MKDNQTSILLFGRDEHLLVTRQWVLQSRGYRVLTIGHLSEIASIPKVPPIQVLLLCHSLLPGEGAAAIAIATSRWPEIQSLALVAETSRAPAGILGQLLHTMDGPGRLISIVGDLIAHSASVADSTPP